MKSKNWLKEEIEDKMQDEYFGDFIKIEYLNDIIDDLYKGEPTITTLQAWDKISEFYPATSISLALSFEHFYYSEYVKKPKTNNVSVNSQGNKYTIVIKEGNQDRWLTVDEDTARELVEKLGSALNG